MSTNVKGRFPFIIRKDKSANDNQVRQEDDKEVFCEKRDNVSQQRVNGDDKGEQSSSGHKERQLRISDSNSTERDQEDDFSVKSLPNQSKETDFSLFLKKNKEKETLMVTSTKLSNANEKWSDSIESLNHTSQPFASFKPFSSKDIKSIFPVDKNPDDSMAITNCKHDPIAYETIMSNYDIQRTSHNDSFLFFFTTLQSIKLKLKDTEKELQAEITNRTSLLQAQQEVIESNNFDKADHIETSIKLVSENISTLTLSISQLTSDLIAAKREEFAIEHQYAQGMADISLQFAQLKSSIESEMSSFTTTQLSDHNKSNNRLNKLKEKLFFIKGNIDAEETHIKEEEEKVAAVIRGQSSSLFDELEQYTKQKEALIDEIENYKRRIATREAELVKVDQCIQVKERDIDAIKVNYAQEFSRISIKKRNFNENYRDFEEQERNYLLKRGDYDKRDKEYSEHMDQMKKQINQYENFIMRINEEKLRQKEERALKEQLVDKENALSQEITAISKDITFKQEEIKSHSNEIQRLRVEIKVLESEIKQIDIKMPPLEEEKRTFVKGKQFKEAGRVSNDLKRFIEQRNTHQMTIEQKKQAINENELIVNKVSTQITLLKEEKSGKEREMNEIRYNYLTYFFTTLKRHQGKERVDQTIDNAIEFTKEEIKQYELNAGIKFNRADNLVNGRDSNETSDSNAKLKDNMNDFHSF